MRLLNTHTGKFQDFQDNAAIPPYAILSHTWNENGEQTYQDVRKVQEASKEDAVKRVSSSIYYSALLSDSKQDVLLEPIMKNATSLVSGILEPSPGGEHKFSGVLTLALA